MDFSNHRLNSYSNSTVNSDSSLNKFKNSHSTVTTKEVLSSITDLIADPDYAPWFAKQLKRLGSTRFMELANKARAGSETPQVMFKWMLNNNEIVK